MLRIYFNLYFYNNDRVCVILYNSNSSKFVYALIVELVTSIIFYLYDLIL